MIYNEINNFCKVRDEDRYQFSNRIKFLMDLLKRVGIEYKVVRVPSEYYRKYFYNLYCFGSSNKYLSAHYDVANTNSDNANDNSASVINCIAYKLKNPSINLLILDGEEPGFMGAGSRCASFYLRKYGKSVKWILNLELTGKGKDFFIDNVQTQLSQSIQQNFEEVMVTGTPFNDSFIFRGHGFVSNVLTLFDKTEDGKIDWKLLSTSHTGADSVNTISTEDMRNFVDGILDKIVKTC
jgi:hypothetical protein